MFEKDETVQDLLIADLLETGEDEKTNETVELMHFFRKHSVPVTPDQLKATLLLKEMGLSDIANFAVDARQYVTPQDTYMKALNKLTMADRIKGNAKLGHLLKANANPANSALKPEDVQAKSMKRNEIDKY
ncbi:hypothetical protein [Bacillus atrophaeus]|uniref:hypothetical protein n=2 Tax=Bacillus atrophaeus TaxID=1452 RepID=UPI0022813E22|nr:hypothetical protein [Bacillus atrophaeus]MCY8497587.1 hypothetical protein [Bacillus atrophaeus]MCY8814310.1 hypothetical protein [Bacillus atrophaeus]MCY8816166.1 hypothetical protein [Bacillus atrophaeus]MCY8823093.1 hypothetical protein [Bacillus atrophaeus]MCY8828687.1 hypothetical protein [Bacillus atrophaeus]